jgi:preprotein translocase subunit Sec63
MAKYTFDENGDTFNFFVLTTLAIILIPVTYLNIFKKTGKERKKKALFIGDVTTGNGL